MSRAGDTGKKLGQSIREMVNLMYQKTTKSNFYEGLMEELLKEDEVLECV